MPTNSSGKYVDGFLIPIARANVAAYSELARKASDIWMEYGALEYYECVGDDLNANELVSFRNAAGATEDETVIFSWIIYASKEHRDSVAAAVMQDPRLENMVDKDNEPFDMRRMAYGGFKPLVAISKP